MRRALEDPDLQIVSRTSALILGFVFFVSGASALTFEALWFRQAALAFGASAWAGALVLSSFMSGLALGSGLAARFGRSLPHPLWIYAALELWIGTSGLGLVAVLPELGPPIAGVLGPLQAHAVVLRLARFALAFALLLGPAVAMGATLPLLVRALFGERQDFGRVLGRLYGLNTLGAVAGALGAEMLLVPRLGVLGSGAAAAGLNGLAALLAAWVALRIGSSRPAAAPAAPDSAARRRITVRAHATRLLVAAFLSGATLLALEVLWFRLMVLFTAQTTLAFAWMLGVVLSGIGVGALLAALGLRLWPRSDTAVAAVAFLSGTVTVLTYRAFPSAAMRFGDPNAESADAILPLALCLMFPTSVLSGVMFTWIGKRIHAEIGSAVRATGMLSLVNTLGAGLGPLVATFLLLPRAGLEVGIWILAGSYGVVASCLAARGPLRQWAHGPAHLVAGVLFTVAMVGFPAGQMRELYGWFIQRAFGGREQLVAFREGVIETIGYTQATYLGEPYYFRLCTDAYSMSATLLASQRYMSLFAHIPLALHAEPRDALLISYGVGVTARTLTDAPELTRIDVVDISEEILEMSDLVDGERESPLEDPRVHVHIEDGRYYLQATDRLYDIATGEPPPPAAAGVVNLYTIEYFELLRSRLRPGGIASYWLPVGQLTIRDAKAITSAFCAAFDDCTLWEGMPSEWILVGSRDAPRIDEAALSRPWISGNRGQLEAVGLERPEQVAALFLADASFLKRWSGDVPPLEDDWPHRAPRWGPEPWRREMPAGYAEIAGEWAARRAFQRSAFIARVWPEEFRERSLDEFRNEELVRSIFARRELLRMEELHRLLTQTGLRTLPLWLLDSDADKQRIASDLAGRGLGDATVEYELGIGALARRDYAEAAHRLDQVDALEHPRAPLYGIYALAMAGDVAGAEERLRWIAASVDPERAAFARFMRAKFDLGEESASSRWKAPAAAVAAADPGA